MAPRLFACLAVGLLLAVSGIVQAAPVTVENFSFEDPAQGKIKGWNGEGVAGTPAVDIPGWASDTAPEDSGIETGWGPTDGEYTGFLMGDDPSTYNLTDHTIAAGEVFELLVDARITGAATQFQMDLYYDDGGTRVQAATATVDLAADMTEYSLPFAANDVPGSIGKKIGIELDNPAGGWLGMDNVRLDVVPEPTTLVLGGVALLGLLSFGWRRKKA